MRRIAAAVTSGWLAALLLTGCAVAEGTAPADPAGDRLEAGEENTEAAEERGEEETKSPDEAKENDGKQAAEEEKRPSVLTDESGREYSANTLIVHLEPDTGEAASRALAERHGLEIVYLYKSFSSMAVKTPRPLTSEEMKILREELEAEAAVLGTEPDYITRLDDPVTTPELMG